MDRVEEVEKPRVPRPDVHRDHRQVELARDHRRRRHPFALVKSQPAPLGDASRRKDDAEPPVLDRPLGVFHRLARLRAAALVLAPLDRRDHALHLRQHAQDVRVCVEEQVRAQRRDQVVQNDAVGDPRRVVRDDQRRPVARDAVEACRLHVLRQQRPHRLHDLLGREIAEVLGQRQRPVVAEHPVEDLPRRPRIDVIGEKPRGSFSYEGVDPIAHGWGAPCFSKRDNAPTLPSVPMAPARSA